MNSQVSLEDAEIHLKTHRAQERFSQDMKIGRWNPDVHANFEEQAGIFDEMENV